jgi:hypothetical protein
VHLQEAALLSPPATYAPIAVVASALTAQIQALPARGLAKSSLLLVLRAKVLATSELESQAMEQSGLLRELPALPCSLYRCLLCYTPRIIQRPDVDSKSLHVLQRQSVGVDGLQRQSAGAEWPEQFVVAPLLLLGFLGLAAIRSSGWVFYNPLLQLV